MNHHVSHALTLAGGTTQAKRRPPTDWNLSAALANFPRLQSAALDHYATLGLDRDCTDAQIRAAYRLLAKQHHPDRNGGSRAAVTQTQVLNAAYEILSDPARRREYDRELATRKRPVAHAGKSALNLAKDVHVCIQDFLRGT